MKNIILLLLILASAFTVGNFIDKLTGLCPGSYWIKLPGGSIRPDKIWRIYFLRVVERQMIVFSPRNFRGFMPTFHIFHQSAA